MATAELLISADSHVLEPADLWLQRLPVTYRDRAPRVFFHEPRGSWMRKPRLLTNRPMTPLPSALSGRPLPTV